MMSGWTVPLSSSPQPPSTPGSNQTRASLFPKSPNGITKNGLASNPSTTPAGPPPSSVGSFTPADPPPSSVFGSSQLGSGKTLFKSKGSASTNLAPRNGIDPSFSGWTDGNKLTRKPDKGSDVEFSDGDKGKRRHGNGRRNNGLFEGLASDYGEDFYGEQSEAYSEGDDKDGDMITEVESGLGSRSFYPDSTFSLPPNKPSTYRKSAAFDFSVLNPPTRGVKRSRGDSRLSTTSPDKVKLSSRSKKDSNIPSIAKSMATQYGIAKLEERDDFIVGTEDLIQQDLYGTKAQVEQRKPEPAARLSTASERLGDFWRSWCDRELSGLALEQSSIKGIGPDENSAPVHKATFLSALLLQLRHPPKARGNQASAISRHDKSLSSSRTLQMDHAPLSLMAIPKILIDWLNDNHDPYGSLDIDVQSFSPDPSAHINYWDVLSSLTLRGKLADVIRILKKSDFQHARTAKEDRKDGNGYNGVQVRNIERVIYRAIEVLEHCPTLQHGNWNITGNEWIMFRKRIEQAMSDLATFAESRDRDTNTADSTFEASNFGLRSSSMNLSQSARKAESRVPWTVYQNLKTMYGILLGGSTEIIAMAQDWVEATIGLTVWWVGDDDEDVLTKSVMSTRRSLRESRTSAVRLVDVNADIAYQRQLATAFQRVIDDDLNDNGLSVNTLNPVEVGLASVFEGNVEGVMGLLSAWSLPIASAVAEVASAGGWLESLAGAGIMNGLDESDLMLLSGRASREQPMTRDAILAQYADALSHRTSVSIGEREIKQEGWELSICLLTRLDDEALAARKVSDLLHRLPKDSDVRVDLILRTCEQFGITNEARAIAEEYADYVAETTDHYGTALIYYARAHQKSKVKDVLDLLISLSLVQSIAYPALPALDPNLFALIFTPGHSLEQLALTDSKAAEMLHTYLTGYATLRKFYDLRDEVAPTEDDEQPRMGLIARKNGAATALIAVINSAADNIHGGLYDEDRGAIVQVDGLLALLGEAMIFINQPDILLSLPQCFSVLKAIEDLQTVARRIYSQCEECFRSTVAARQGQAKPGSPRALLKKTMSSATSSSSFFEIRKSMVQLESSGTNDSTRALVKSEETSRRGWDWRKGLGDNAKGEDVLRVLRLGLAKDIAKHWMISEGA